MPRAKIVIATKYSVSVRLDDSWSFKEATRTETSYLTHSYHRYPAKFIPQLAARLIKENSRPGDLVCDPFMGSGTTLVEAIVNGRNAYGADINPVAVLIAKAKTTAIEPSRLESIVMPLVESLNQESPADLPSLHSSSRIDYWFAEKQKKDLALVLRKINAVSDREVQTFLLCAFSNILKGCSRWMTRSVKPTRDRAKIFSDAKRTFALQVKRMMTRNQALWNIMNARKIDCQVDNSDARRLALGDASASLVVTSPPYVTSYEYADLHQLSALWLGYSDAQNFREFRSRFIGSIQKSNHTVANLSSPLAVATVQELRSKDPRAAAAAERYFFEMQQSFEEMKRILVTGGRAAVVIGDTALRKVKIKNAEIFAETMRQIGFKKYQIIERPVPGKILPLTRDEKTGKFATIDRADRLAYPTEFIIIMEKT